MTKIELVKGTAFELNPDKKYLLLFEESQVSTKNVKAISDLIRNMGIENLSIVTEDVDKVKIIEA